MNKTKEAQDINYLKKIKTYFPDVHLAGKNVRFYHGTPILDIVLEEGLRGGDNTTGGTHGVWKKPILFCTPSYEVAEKYGEVVVIEMSFEEFWKRNFDSFNDGLGDKVYSLECDDFETILIESDFLSEI